MSGKLATTSVAGDLAGHLRRLIHSGELSEGDRLPAERDLAASFGVARISVREALRALHSDGYLTVRRGGGGGTFVAALDHPYATWLAQMRHRTGELDAILDLRIAVEGPAPRLAPPRRNKNDLNQLRFAPNSPAGPEPHTRFRSAHH